MAWIVGMSGAVKGRRYEIDRDETSIGRRDDSHILLADSSVSSRHCVILRAGEKYTVRDLGSTNGTYVNGSRVQETRLKPKDILQVGSVEFMFDGENVESDGEVASATAKIEVAEGPCSAPTTFQSASPFGARRDHRLAWMMLTAVLSVIALAIVAAFLINLFR